MIVTWAVVATKNRPELVRQCIASLLDQVTGIVVVDNNDEPDVGLEQIPGVVIVHHPGYPPNLSELLNTGMVEATKQAGNLERWNVALLNDDVSVAPGWVASLHAALEQSGAALAFVGRDFDIPSVWACLVRGELGVRFDEDLKWWYGDNLFVEECRRNHGGIIAVGSSPLPTHYHPNLNTNIDPVLSAQAGRDAQVFSQKLRERGW
jgi:glycosyltransferase involved in cell wall biosynthesis